MIDKPTPMTEADMLSAVGHLCMNQKTAEKLVDLARDEYQAIIAARDAQWIALLKSKSIDISSGDYDLICNAIDAADTITMESGYMLDSNDCIDVVRTMQALIDTIGKKSNAKLEQLELAEWRRLQNPDILHLNLLRGIPAKLTREQLLHLVGFDNRTYKIAVRVPRTVTRYVWAYQKTSDQKIYTTHRMTEDELKSYLSEIKYEFYEAIEATMATQDETILVDIYSEE